MKLVSGKPFWPIIDHTKEKYPVVDRNLDSEILIIGGGITSALVALAFHQAGVEVVLISDQTIGHGSTSASTALLQYEIDEDLIDLAEMIGEENAVKAYQLCGQAIDAIAEIDRRFPSDFAYRPSVYLAAAEADMEKMKKECEARSNAGFDVRWLNRNEVADFYGLQAAGAIDSKLGGEIDPYKLTQRIFQYLRSQGASIYERTEIAFDEKDGQKLKTKDGFSLRANRAIFAGGYRSQGYLSEKVVTLHSTYAFVTDQLPEEMLWSEKALWWDSADPYIYARTTADNRIMVGGGDTSFWQAALRERAHQKQIGFVTQSARQYYPSADWHIAYSWNGVFGETKDGLAYIGAPEEWQNADFALGFGGNGITYSQLAADILVEKYRGTEPEMSKLFYFGR